jgi:hypothetical protein
VQRAFYILYQETNCLDLAVEKIHREFPDVSVINSLLQFIRKSKRGVVFGNKLIEELALPKGREDLLETDHYLDA